MNLIVLSGMLITAPKWKNNSSSPIRAAGFVLSVKRPDDSGVTDIFNCTCFKKYADSAMKYLKEKSLVTVKGQCQIRQFTTKDGVHAREPEILVDHLEFHKTQ